MVVGPMLQPYAYFRVMLMAPSRRPVLPDKIMGIAMIGRQPDPGSRNELLVGTFPHSVQDQAGTHSDDECSSYSSKEGTHEHLLYSRNNSYRIRAGGN